MVDGDTDADRHKGKTHLLSYILTAILAGVAIYIANRQAPAAATAVPRKAANIFTLVLAPSSPIRVSGLCWRNGAG